MSKTEPFQFDLWVKSEMNIVPVQGNAFSSALKKRSTQTSKTFLPNVYIARQGGTHTLGPHVGPRRLVTQKYDPDIRLT